MGEVTKQVVPYPKGQEPTWVNPKTYQDYRYGIGRDGAKPLVVVCMNPSAARDNTSDRTVNRVISASEKLGYDGWAVFNTYPERGTDAATMADYQPELVKENVAVLRDYLVTNGVKEVWCAWGNLKYEALQEGRNAILDLFDELGIRGFQFKAANKSGNPQHPLYLKIEAENKQPYDWKGLFT
jgi:hypothetical protein